jgi:hypothetical protein
VGLSAWLVGLLRSEGSTADEAMRRLRDLLLCGRSVTAVELGPRISYLSARARRSPSHGSLGAGTGIVSLIVAALRARHCLPRPETASEEPHPRASDCIISTDLGESSTLGLSAWAQTPTLLLYRVRDANS